MVLYITIDNLEFECVPHAEGFLLSGKPMGLDLIQVQPLQYHLIHAGTSYSIYVEQMNTAEKWIQLRINGLRVKAHIETETDRLLKTMGFSDLAKKGSAELRAPMPGLLLNVLVSEGDTVKKGDVIFILEAMKMENALKAMQDGIVKEICVKKGQTVEKNQVLIKW
jgi:biotin carboxyl carrier protein